MVSPERELMQYEEAVRYSKYLAETFSNVLEDTEVFQECLLCWAKISNTDGFFLPTYYKTAMFNRTVDMYRREKLRRKYFRDCDFANAVFDVDSKKPIDPERLLAKIPDSMKKSKELVRCILSGLSLKEAAIALDISYSAAAVRFHRVKQRLYHIAKMKEAKDARCLQSSSSKKAKAYA